MRVFGFCIHKQRLMVVVVGPKSKTHSHFKEDEEEGEGDEDREEGKMGELKKIKIKKVRRSGE